jgi:hypothetical protein
MAMVHPHGLIGSDRAGRTDHSIVISIADAQQAV